MLAAGFAGACLPELRVGDVIVTSPALATQLKAAGTRLHTLERVVSPAEKAALGAEGFHAVDMENAWLEQAATAAGVPFVGVRVIIDRLPDRAISLATAANYVRAAKCLRQAVDRVLERWP